MAHSPPLIRMEHSENSCSDYGEGVYPEDTSSVCWHHAEELVIGKGREQTADVPALLQMLADCTEGSCVQSLSKDLLR